MSIFIIEDFMSQDDCVTISSVFDNLCVPHPHLFGYLSTTGFQTSNDASSLSLDNPIIKISGVQKSDEASLLLTRHILRLKDEMQKHFSQQMSVVNCNYVQMLKGSSNGLHSDSTDLDGIPYHDAEELEFSGLLYFNNYGEDFTGGEIVFPNQNIVVKPKAGTAVFFRGDVEHQHEVNFVRSGIRKNAVIFMSRFGNTSDRSLFDDSTSKLLTSEK